MINTYQPQGRRTSPSWCRHKSCKGRWPWPVVPQDHGRIDWQSQDRYHRDSLLQAHPMGCTSRLGTRGGSVAAILELLMRSSRLESRINLRGLNVEVRDVVLSFLPRISVCTGDEWLRSDSHKERIPHSCPCTRSSCSSSKRDSCRRLQRRRCPTHRAQSRLTRQMSSAVGQ